MNDPNTSAFKTLAANVKTNVLREIRKHNADVEDVLVTGFREASVIAEYNVILKAGAATVSASTMQSAIENTIKDGSFTGLPVDISYIPTVEGMCFKLKYI